MYPVARSTEVACALKRKYEPESKAFFLLFPSGWILWNQLFTSILFSIPLTGSGTVPQYVRVITSVIEREGRYCTEQTVTFAVSECYKCTTLTFSCSTTNYTNLQHSYSGIITPMTMNWKAFSVKCYFAVVGLIPSVQNDYLV